MTNQLNSNQKNVNANLNKLWFYSIIFLSALVLITLFSSASILQSSFYLTNITLCVVFLVVILIVKLKKNTSAFVKVEENKLQYFCPVKKEMVIIPVEEIIHTSSHFCELQIHTTNRTHCINLDKIKQEQQRWEIKEMIKKLPTEKNSKACNF